MHLCSPICKKKFSRNAALFILSLAIMCFVFVASHATPYEVICYLKGEGEKALQQNNLRQALENYNQALKLVESLMFIPIIWEEYHKIVCNRALVNLKMMQYREAERDAQLCIGVMPDSIKVL